VLVGHAHNYERFEAMDADAVVDSATGITEFVVGTGGRGLFTDPAFGAIRASSSTPMPSASSS